MLARSCLPGTEIALIINIHAVGNRLKATSCGKCFHHLKEFVFAVEAPLAIIADVFRPVHFAGLDDLNGNAMFLREGKRVLKLGTSQARGVRDYGQHIAAKNLVRDPCQISRINSAGVGDQRAAKRLERIFEEMLFRVQIHN